LTPFADTLAITAGEVDEYLHSKLGQPGYFEDDLLEEARKKATEAGIPDIAVSAMQGQFLNILCKSIGASRILEIGTLWG
jgi:predicted O-methyltransferase YrrM